MRKAKRYRIVCVDCQAFLDGEWRKSDASKLVKRVKELSLRLSMDWTVQYNGQDVSLCWIRSHAEHALAVIQPEPTPLPEAGLGFVQPPPEWSPGGLAVATLGAGRVVVGVAKDSAGVPLIDLWALPREERTGLDVGAPVMRLAFLTKEAAQLFRAQVDKIVDSIPSDGAPPADKGSNPPGFEIPGQYIYISGYRPGF